MNSKTMGTDPMETEKPESEDLVKRLRDRSNKNTYEIVERFEDENGDREAEVSLHPEITLENVKVTRTGNFAATLETAEYSIRIRERSGAGTIQAVADFLDTKSGIQSTGTKLRHQAIEWAGKRLEDHREKEFLRRRREATEGISIQSETGRILTFAQLPRIFDRQIVPRLEEAGEDGEVQNYRRVLRFMAVLFPGLEVSDLRWEHYETFARVRVGRGTLTDKSDRPVRSQADLLKEHDREYEIRAEDHGIAATFDEDGRWVEVDERGFVPEGYEGSLYDSRGNLLPRRRDKHGRPRYSGSGCTIVIPEGLAVSPRKRYYYPVSRSQPPRDFVFLSTALRRLKERSLIPSNPVLDDIVKHSDFDSNQRGSGEVASTDRFHALHLVADEVDPTGRLRYMLVKAWKHGHRIGAIRMLEEKERAESRQEVRRLLNDLPKSDSFKKRSDERMDRRAANFWERAHYVPPHKDKDGYCRVVPLDDEMIAEEVRYIEKRKQHFPDSKWTFPSDEDPTRPLSEEDAADLLRAAEYRARERLEEAGLDPDRFVPIFDGDIWHPYRRKWQSIREKLGFQYTKHAAYVGCWSVDLGDTQHTVYGEVDPRLALAAVDGMPYKDALEYYGISEQASKEAKISGAPESFDQMAESRSAQDT